MNNAQRFVPLCLILLVLVGLPLAALSYQSYRTGMTWSQILRRSLSHAGGTRTGLEGMPSNALPKGEKIEFLQPRPIGDPFDSPPKISQVEAVDLDQDGLLDILVCDCENNRVSWIRQHPRGQFTEYILCEDLIAPARAEVVDFNGNGHLDLVVAVLGMLFPNNDPIGSVVLLENDGRMQFTRRVVLDKVPRVADVRAGDLNGNGLLDLAVAHFGYDDGETRWLENLGDGKFRSHILQSLSGPIHCPIVDIDQDGHLDIIVLVSQEWEEIYVHHNDGKGGFRPVRIFGSDNEDFGASSIYLVDFNQNGRTDILFTNGDAFDYIPPVPRPWHGVQWLENLGGLSFRVHRIADVPGAVNARPADINGNGHLDLYVASAYNMWEDPAAQSLVWLENDGQMRFRLRDIANRPTHIQGLDVGDFRGDGILDVVTGGLHTYGPNNRMERVVLWTNRWKDVVSGKKSAAAGGK